MIAIRRYKNTFDCLGESATITDLLEATKQDSDVKRAIRNEPDKEKRRDLKQKRAAMWYPCGSVSGRFCESAITPGGVVQFDLDSEENDPERLAELKTRLSKIPSVFFVSLSVSGRGLYALAKVPVSVQTDKAAQLAFLDIVEEVVLYDARPSEHLDDNCAKSAQRRFEGFDPEPYYNPDASEYVVDYRGLCDKAFESSALCALAGYFGGHGVVTPGCAQTGLAMAVSALYAGGRVSGRLFSETYYKARAQVIVLGDSGAGKTNLLDGLEDVSYAAGAKLLNSGSDREMEKQIVDASADIASYALDENGKPDKKKPNWVQRPIPTPLLGIFDEAGDVQEARKNTGYKSQLNAIRRRCFNRHYMPESTISTPLPQIPLRISYTDVQCSTPKAWADALAGEDTTRGDLRRALEFWLDKPSAREGARNARLSSFIQGLVTPPKPCNSSAISGWFDLAVPALENPDENGISRYLSGELDLYEFARAAMVLQEITGRAGADEDAKTVVGNLATLIAYARGSVDTIDASDVRAAWSIYFAVLENRNRLSDVSDIGRDTWKTQITKAVLGYIEARGKVRVSQVVRSFKKRGEEYKLEYERLVRDGVLFIEKGKSSVVRLATEEEASRVPEPDFSEERKNRDKVDHGEAKPFSECSDEEKVKRLNNYLEKHGLGEPMEDGNVDDSLISLAGKLAANGMWEWGGVTEKWFRDLAFSKGHTEKKDQDRVLRLIKKKLDAKTVA